MICCQYKHAALVLVSRVPSSSFTCGLKVRGGMQAHWPVWLGATMREAMWREHCWFEYLANRPNPHPLRLTRFCYTIKCVCALSNTKQHIVS